MVRALGISDTPFDPSRPDRLCRGRERWVDAVDAPATPLWRLVASGATFSDASAEDALRGFVHSGIDAGAFLGASFPKAPLAAFCEAGDPRALPSTMWVEEDWMRPLVTGRRQTPAVRWLAPCAPAQVAPWMAGEVEGVACPRADGFLVGVRGATPELLAALYALVGQQSIEERTVARYDASAIPAVLQHCTALVLLHEDKHGPVLAIYTNEPTECAGTIDWLARESGAVNVPFEIPPMLARWDRAIWKLQEQWEPDTDGEFPVPPAEDTRRSRRRRRSAEDGPTPAFGAATPEAHGEE